MISNRSAVAVILISLLMTQPTFASNESTRHIRLPRGFSISVYADNLADVGEMAITPKGTVFAGSGKAGKVYAILPAPDYSKAKSIITLGENLALPYGVAFYKKDLYVASLNQIFKYKNVENRLFRKQYPLLVKRGLPAKRWHGKRYLGFDPHGRLYESIGMPCNTCLMKNNLYGSIVRMQRNGSYFETYAMGVRYSLGFAWNPKSLNFWFSDIGQKNLGNHIPPDEINCAPIKHMHFGFPYFYGNNVPSPHYGHLQSHKHMTPPSLSLPAHVKPEGMTFYTGSNFPRAYHNGLFVALHGRKIHDHEYGDQILWVKTQKGRVVEHAVFATGFVYNNKALARPTDIKMLPDGSLLVSDSVGHAIYRIAYHKS